jgi:hypothetical protein
MKYKKQCDTIAFEMCLLGATDRQLAAALSVNIDTIHTWKKQHRSFAEALKAGKDPADAKVAAALYKRACGFHYDEVTYEAEHISMKEIRSLKEIKDDLYKSKVITKYCPPDTAAIGIWLRNRQPLLFKDKSTLELLERLPDDQLDKMINDLRNSIKQDETK